MLGVVNPFSAYAKNTEPIWRICYGSGKKLTKTKLKMIFTNFKVMKKVISKKNKVMVRTFFVSFILNVFIDLYVAS